MNINSILSVLVKLLLIGTLVYVLNFLGAFNYIKTYIGMRPEIKDVTSPDSKAIVELYLDKMGVKVKQCSQVLSAGKGDDSSLGQCVILWVTCDNAKYTIKESVTPPKDEKQISALMYYGWVK